MPHVQADTRVAVQLRHGIFKSEATVKDIDEIVAARFVDKRGKLREELERNWQELTINVDALIVNADLKVRARRHRHRLQVR